MKKKQCVVTAFGVAIGLIVAAAESRADIIYSNVQGPGGGQEGPPAAPRLDDVVFGNGGPATINAIRFAYYNTSLDFVTVDAVIRFYDDVNVSAGGSTVVTSGDLGTYNIPIPGTILDHGAVPGGWITLSPAVSVPDGDLGVSIAFNIAGTTQQSPVQAMIDNKLGTVGSTFNGIWSDDLTRDGQFTGNERVTPPIPGAAEYVNLYLEMQGTLPEPAAGTVAVGALPLLARRRRHRSPGRA